MSAVHLPITELYSGSPDGGYDLGYSPGGNRGIQYDGKHFLFLRQGGEYEGDGKIHILKSTDDGATWSDVANFDAGLVPSIATCRDGNLAYIIYTDTVYDGTSHCTDLSARSFNLDTDSLSSVICTGPTPEKLWAGGDYQVSGRVGIAIATRSEGEMLAIYPSAPSGGYNRLSFVTFNGSAFGTPVPISGVSGEWYVVSSAIVDSAGVWHAIIDRSTVSSSFRDLLHLPVDAGGTSAAAQVIVTGLSGPLGGFGPPQPVGQLIVFGSGSGEKVAFPDAESGSVYYADAGNTDPLWSSVSFSPSPPPQQTSTIGWALGSSLLATADGLSVFWTTFGTPTYDYDVSENLGKIYTRSAAYGALGTWSTPAIAMQSDDFAASTTMAYRGPDGGGVFGGFVQSGASDRGEDRWWYGVTGGVLPSVEYPNEFD